MAVGRLVEYEILEKVISCHMTEADVRIPPQNFEVAIPATVYTQELELSYAKPESGQPPTADGLRDAPDGLRRVEPLHIACIDFYW